jgi:hypothetical protein
MVQRVKSSTYCIVLPRLGCHKQSHAGQAQRASASRNIHSKRHFTNKDHGLAVVLAKVDSHALADGIYCTAVCLSASLV